MGKLTDAIKLLTDLKDQLTAQTLLATTAITNKNYASAETLLEKEVQHANECLEEVKTARSSSSRNVKNPKFGILDGLQTEITALCDNLEVLKNQCVTGKAALLAEAEAQRQASIDAERRTKTEAERQAREEAARQTKTTAALQAKAATERQAKASAELQAKVIAEQQAKLVAEHQARAEAETKRHAEAEAKRQAEAEAETKRHIEAQAKRRQEATAEFMRHEEAAAELRRHEEAEEETRRSLVEVALLQIEAETPLQIEINAQGTENNETITPLLLAEDPEQGYAQALQKLKEFKMPPHSKSVDDYVVRLINVIEKQKGKERTSDLIEALEKTYLRLTTTFPPEQYEDIARSMQGKPSTGMKVIGGIMIALAVALAALAIVFAPALLGLAAAVALTGTAATIATGAVVTVTSTSIAATGIGLFAQGFKRKGISEAMSNLNKATPTKTEEPSTTALVA